MSTPPWMNAVREALSEPARDTEQTLRDELVNLWSDLHNAQRNAYNGRWSVGCDWYAGRIVTLTRLVGATSWEQVQADLLLNGTYEGLLTAAGIEYEQPDWDAVRKLDRYNKGMREAVVTSSTVVGPA